MRARHYTTKTCNEINSLVISTFVNGIYLNEFSNTVFSQKNFASVSKALVFSTFLLI